MNNTMCWMFLAKGDFGLDSAQPPIEGLAELSQFLGILGDLIFLAIVPRSEVEK